MLCKKCDGRVFVDRVFTSTTRVELFCLMCGRRWMISTDRNRFAQWLHKKEKEVSVTSAGTTST